MRERVSILAGNTFVISDGSGDITPSPVSPTGLFAFDTRFLSKWLLTINGERLNALSIDDLQFYEARFFLVPGEPTPYLNAQLSVVRRRAIGGSFDEELAVFNHRDEPVELTVRIVAASDFADLFEIKDMRDKFRAIQATVSDGRLHLIYRREHFRRETVISSSPPALVDEQGLTWQVRIEPQQEWVTQIRVDVLIRGGAIRGPEMGLKQYAQQVRIRMQEELNEWLDPAPDLFCDCPALKNAYTRSLVDIAALRIVSGVVVGKTMPAAGLPWFMAAFGRDSLITSLQVLPYIPEMAATTLGVLATGQGSRLDDFRDEEPGKIQHENRYGELAGFEEVPHSPYYGSADSTPLFVVLLDEYERWTGDTDLVRRFEHEARLALAWIDDYGNFRGDGYIWYQTRNPKQGLVNQCWKDSPDAICYADGRIPGLPRATCELQGYAYDAKMRGARLARLCWNDPAYADRLEAEAAALKTRFNRDFWIADGEYYALALDGDGGQQVDALASNMGHLLWSGIVEPDRASKIVEHLLGPRLFSGWGVRTLATGQRRFNPIGYHVGTVWPFDNSIIAWGLRRYGYSDEAAVLAQGIIDAAGYYDGRLPEAFAGYDRARTKYPVQYPTACSPQAWSSGAVPLLIRTMLGLDPQPDRLLVDPVLPAGIGNIELTNIHGRWGQTSAQGGPRTSGV